MELRIRCQFTALTQPSGWCAQSRGTEADNAFSKSELGIEEQAGLGLRAQEGQAESKLGNRLPTGVQI